MQFSILRPNGVSKASSKQKFFQFAIFFWLWGCTGCFFCFVFLVFLIFCSSFFFFRIVCWPWLKVCVVLINFLFFGVLRTQKVGSREPRWVPAANLALTKCNFPFWAQMGSQRHHESKIFYNLRFFFDFEVALDVFFVLFFLFSWFFVQASFF